MPDFPKLTVAIPTLDRAHFLDRSIQSLLAQRTPVKILISDQGKTEATAKIVAKYAANPLVNQIESPATTLWQNWRFAAEQCDTPYFAWLQDDDKVYAGYADRIINAFEAWPEIHTWIARLAISADGITGLWYAGNGGFFPMRLLDGIPTLIEGKMFTPLGYCSSMALSPAVAFRCGDEFSRVLQELPDEVDLWQERLVLAAMGENYPIASDPALVGYWIHHSRNECYRQRKNQPEQTVRAYAFLDRLMDRLEGEWRYPFNVWLEHLPLPHLAGMGSPVWDKLMEHSKYCEEMRACFRKCVDRANKPQSGVDPNWGGLTINTDITDPNRLAGPLDWQSEANGHSDALALAPAIAGEATRDL